MFHAMRASRRTRSDLRRGGLMHAPSRCKFRRKREWVAQRCTSAYFARTGCTHPYNRSGRDRAPAGRRQDVDEGVGARQCQRKRWTAGRMCADTAMTSGAKTSSGVIDRELGRQIDSPPLLPKPFSQCLERALLRHAMRIALWNGPPRKLGRERVHHRTPLSLRHAQPLVVGGRAGIVGVEDIADVGHRS